MSGGSPKKPKPTAQERALAEVSSQQWADYNTRFRPLIAQVNRQNVSTTGEKSIAMGRAATDVAIASAGADRGVTRNALDVQTTALSRAGARGNATAGARLAMDDQEIAGMTRMVAHGRNIADDTRTSMISAGRDATASAIGKLDAQLTRDAGRRQALGAVAGGAVRHYYPDMFGRN